MIPAILHSARKMSGYENVWEARVDDHYRFTYSVENGTLTLRAIGPRDEVLSRP